MSFKLNFQDRVAGWMAHCFGIAIAMDKVERNHRLERCARFVTEEVRGIVVIERKVA